MIKPALIFLLFFALISEGFCQSESQLELGLDIGFHSLYINKLSEGSNDIVAQFDSDFSISSYLGISSYPKVATGVSFSMKHAIYFSQSYFVKQKVNRVSSDEKDNPYLNDYKTSMLVYGLFYSPAFNIFYKTGNNSYMYTGLGVGLGVLDIDGDFYETEGPEISKACEESITVESITQNCKLTKKSARVIGYSLNWELFGYIFNQFSFKVGSESPESLFHSEGSYNYKLAKAYVRFGMMF